VKCWSHISTGVSKRKISPNLGSAFALAVTERRHGLGWEGRGPQLRLQPGSTFPPTPPPLSRHRGEDKPGDRNAPCPSRVTQAGHGRTPRFSAANPSGSRLAWAEGPGLTEPPASTSPTTDRAPSSAGTPLKAFAVREQPRSLAEPGSPSRVPSPGWWPGHPGAGGSGRCWLRPPERRIARGAAAAAAGRPGETHVHGDGRRGLLLDTPQPPSSQRCSSSVSPPTDPASSGTGDANDRLANGYLLSAGLGLLQRGGGLRGRPTATGNRQWG